MATIGIIGYGYVGKAIAYGLKTTNKILAYDKYLSLTSLPDLVKKSDFIFICVPTPMTRAYTKIDLSIINQVFKDTVSLARTYKREPIIIIKSTVIPGTTRNLIKKYNWPKTIFNPEFLREEKYLHDFVHADRIIIGGNNKKDVKNLANLYKRSLPNIPIFQTDPTSAEMTKYMANTYLATKVVFANEISNLCERMGIKYQKVKRMVVADKRIFDSHFDVSLQKGFGGKCFPKDTVALLGLANQLGVELSVLKSAWKKNLKIRKVRDWEAIPGAVSKKSPR